MSRTKRIAIIAYLQI